MILIYSLFCSLWKSIMKDKCLHRNYFLHCWIAQLRYTVVLRYESEKKCLLGFICKLEKQVIMIQYSHWGWREPVGEKKRFWVWFFFLFSLSKDIQICNLYLLPLQKVFFSQESPLKITLVYDQSIASTKTKYIKLNTKTQIFF